MFQTPTTRVWKELYDAGKLRPPRTYFWEPKPPEELYDLQNDPDEVHNLADSPAHQDILRRLRAVEQEHARRIRDVGFLPEGEIHSRARGRSPYEVGHDDALYPFDRIFATAELASSLKPEALPKLRQALRDPDSAVRYWAALGLLMRKQAAVGPSRTDLQRALHDRSPYVRIVAAQALAQYGSKADLQPALDTLAELAPTDKNGIFVSLMAVNAIDDLDEKATSLAPLIRSMSTKDPHAPPRTGGYVARVIPKLLADLEEKK